MRILRALGLLLLPLLFSACKSSDSFSFLEESPDALSGEVKIVSYIPVGDPIVITNNSRTTFAVTLGASAGDGVIFSWVLDGVELTVGEESFYELTGSDVTSGSHQLVVKAENSQHKASHTFNLRKNTPASIDTTSPAPTGNTINVGTSLTLQATASDADSDSLTFAWKFNGAFAPSLFTTTDSATGSSTVFTPTSAQTGSGLVSLEVNDGHESTAYTWAVDVVDPVVATINSFAPVASPVVITSSGSVDFSISAIAKTPTTYRWTLDGTTVVGAVGALYTLNGAGLSVGNHTLIAYVEDSDSSDSHTFTIKRNGPPVIANPLATPTSLTINYTSLMTLSIDASDPNGDNLNYQWKIDNNSSSTLSPSNTATGSQAIFQPTSVWTGDHSISVVVSDGVESDSYSWAINVNRFSENCNQSGAGKICTLVGNPSVGHTLRPIDDQTKMKIQPRYVIDDGSGNWIFSDLHNDAVWVYNRSGAAINRVGISIAANSAAVVAGAGAPGKSNELAENTDFKLYNPDGLAYDSVNNRLFIADLSNHRVVMIASNGQGQTILGTGANNGGNTASNTDGNPGTSHVCASPRDLHYQSPYLFVSCSGSHSIKQVYVDDGHADSGKAWVAIGQLNGSGTSSAGTGDGTFGAAGTAKVSGPQGLAMDSSGNLYWSEVNGNNCRLRVWNRTALTINYFNGDVPVLAGQTGTLAGVTNNCGYTTGDNTARASLRWGQAYDLEVIESGGVIGFVMASYNYHRAMFINNTNSDQTFANVLVSAKSGSTILGTASSYFNGDGYAGTITWTRNPMGVSLSADGVNLLFADVSNYRVRKLDTVTGLVATDVGAARLRYGAVGGGDEDATTTYLDRPYDLSVDQSNNILYFTDSLNYRVRKVDLSTGLVSTVIGSGTAGDGNIENEDPQNVLMRQPRSVTPHGDHLLFSDTTSANCMVRTFKRNSSADQIFGVSIVAQKVSTIAGNFVSGCGAITGLGGKGYNARLQNPEGLASDGSNLYVADSSAHCVLKITATGDISAYVGVCNTGSTAVTDGVLANARLYAPTTIVLDPEYPSSGNMFIVDQSDRGNAKIRYVNKTAATVRVAGVNVATESIQTLFVESGTPHLYGAAAFGNQFCYSSGSTNGLSGNHNVICRNRSDDLAPLTMRAGSGGISPATSGGPLNTEQEGQPPNDIRLNKPSGLAFDASGNLYIVEYGNSLIRRVKRWFP